MNKCIIPWISLETTPLGGLRPCCLYKDEIPNVNLRTHTLEEVFAGEYMQDLRAEFESGEKPSACERCWAEENAGKKSKREYMLEKFKHMPFEENLVFLDLKLGNICNLKCRICGEWSSSKWAQEKVEQFGNDHLAKQWLKDGQWPRKNPGFWDNLDSLLPNIKYFEFTGGEPFLIKQHFDLLQRAVDLGYAKDIDIHYNTNGTQFPKQHEVWKHFKHVQIAFSIDNTEKRFEYERYGAKWSTVNNNIKRFLKMRDEGYPFSLQLCITWNLQNTYYMQKILTWAKQSGIDDIHFNLMHDPEEYNLQNVPRNAQAEFMHALDKALVMHGDYANQIRSIKKFLLMDPKIESEQIVEKIRVTDNHRGISFADTHSEVAALIGYD